MQPEIIVGLLSCAGTLIGTLGGIIATSKLTNYRLQQLESEVREHNNFARRLPVVEEQIKTINERIEIIEKRN